MDTILTFLHELQAISEGQPLTFALLVILVMVLEGLLLVGVITLLMKLFSKTKTHPG